MKHTPGNWKSARKEGNYIIVTDLPIEKNNGCLAIVGTGLYNTKHELFNEAEANAKLIAAAPDMLDELQCTERYLDFVKQSLQWLSENPTGNIAGWISNQREMLNARIDRNQAAIQYATSLE